MAVSEKEKYHGAVLYQVVTNPDRSLKLIDRDKKKHGFGMYEVDTDSKDYILFIKYSSNPYKHKRQRRQQRVTYNFIFSLKDIAQLQKHLVQDKEMLACLVCDDKHICTLLQRDINELKLTETISSCTVSVSCEKNTGLTVRFRGSELSHKVPRNRLQTLFK